MADLTDAQTHERPASVCGEFTGAERFCADCGWIRALHEPPAPDAPDEGPDEGPQQDPLDALHEATQRLDQIVAEITGYAPGAADDDRR